MSKTSLFLTKTYIGQTKVAGERIAENKHQVSYEGKMDDASNSSKYVGRWTQTTQTTTDGLIKRMEGTFVLDANTDGTLWRGYFVLGEQKFGMGIIVNNNQQKNMDLTDELVNIVLGTAHRESTNVTFFDTQFSCTGDDTHVTLLYDHITEYKCTTCPPGRFADVAIEQHLGMLTHCTECAKGKYQNLDGQTMCNDAQSQMYVAKVGASTWKELPCPVGLNSGGEAECGKGELEYFDGFWHDGLDFDLARDINTSSGTHRGPAVSDGLTGTMSLVGLDEASFTEAVRTAYISTLATTLGGSGAVVVDPSQIALEIFGTSSSSGTPPTRHRLDTSSASSSSTLPLRYTVRGLSLQQKSIASAAVDTLVSNATVFVAEFRAAATAAGAPLPSSFVDVEDVNAAVDAPTLSTDDDGAVAVYHHVNRNIGRKCCSFEYMRTDGYEFVKDEGFYTCPKGWVTATGDKLGEGKARSSYPVSTPDGSVNKTARMKLGNCTYFVNTFTQFYRCPGGNETCTVDKLNGSLTCHEGNWGVLCAKCRKGYVMEATGTCTACDADGRTLSQKALPLAIMTLGGMVVLGVVAKHFKVLMSLYSSLKRKLVSRGKLLIVFYQICLLMGKVFQVPFPAAYLKFLAKFDILKIDFFVIFRLGCVYVFKFHDVLYGWTRVVLVLLGFVLVSLLLLDMVHSAQNIHMRPEVADYKAKEKEKEKERDARIQNLEQRMSCSKRFSFWYIEHKIHQMLSRCQAACCHWITCRGRLAKVGEFLRAPGKFMVTLQYVRAVEFLCGNALLGTYLIYPYTCQLIFSTFQCMEVDSVEYLQEDFAVDCASDFHKKAVEWAKLMVLLFPVGLPALYFIMLYPHRYHIRVGDTEHLNHLEFFFKEYDPDYYYWEVIECARKCILMGFASVFRPGTIMQLILVMVLTVIYMMVITKCCPFRRETDSKLAVFVNSALFVILLGALMTKFAKGFEATGVWDDGYSLEFVETVLISTSCLVAVYGIWCVSADLFDVNEERHSNEYHNRIVRVLVHEADHLPERQSSDDQLRSDSFLYVTVKTNKHEFTPEKRDWPSSATVKDKKERYQPPAPKWKQKFEFSFKDADNHEMEVCYLHVEVFEASIQPGLFSSKKSLGSTWVDISESVLPVGHTTRSWYHLKTPTHQQIEGAGVIELELIAISDKWLKTQSGSKLGDDKHQRACSDCLKAIFCNRKTTNMGRNKYFYPYPG
eukprot:g883.t1